MLHDTASVVLKVPGMGSFRDPGPDETHRRGLRLVSDIDESTIGIIGWSTAGHDALALAVENPHVPRLVLVAVPYDVEPNSVEFSELAAKTLLLFGNRDPRAGSSHGRRWQRALPNARLEMVPGGMHDLIAQVWPRILTHVAPGRRR